LRIEGYWNVYHCADCKVDFAISQETDDHEQPRCPHCEEWLPVIHFEADFVERKN
jgi:NAD-dependent SIR2 family protein deacetylase